MHKIYSPRNRGILEQRKDLLTGYLPAGYPDKSSFLDTLVHCERAGIDIFELGYPASNPSADGEVIRSALESLDPSIAEDMDFWRLLRGGVDAPIWIMGYALDLVDTGCYIELAKSGAMDALVIPDLESGRYFDCAETMSKYGVDMVGFVRKSMSPELRSEYISTFPIIYHQLHEGPTGTTAKEDSPEILQEVKKNLNSHVFAGFGISTPERVIQLLESGYDGVIVGSELVRQLNKSREKLYELIRKMSAPRLSSNEI